MFDAEEDEEDTDSETEEKKDVEVTQDRLIDAVKSVRETDSGLMYIMSNFASSISERLNDVLEKYATNKDARDFSSDADLQALVAHLDIDTLETLLDEVEALDDEADKYSVQRSDLYRLSIIQFSQANRHLAQTNHTSKRRTICAHQTIKLDSTYSRRLS